MEAAEILVIIATLIICGLGIIGCIAPGLPGPPLTYIAILVYHLGIGDIFSLTFLIITFIIVAAAAALDYFMPPYLTKKFGGTRWGVWGGIIGLVVGLFVIPWGIIFGPLIGAIIGDLAAGKQFESALKSGFGAFVGFVVATVLKLAVSVTLTIIIVVKMIQHHVPWDALFS